MPDTTTITGAAAKLQWGSADAAALGPWSVNGEPGAWKFSAEIISSNSFRIAQKPLTVLVPNGWRWDVLEMTVNGRTLAATISPRERG
jgi:hypothetical protein